MTKTEKEINIKMIQTEVKFINGIVSLYNDVFLLAIANNKPVIMIQKQETLKIRKTFQCLLQSVKNIRKYLELHNTFFSKEKIKFEVNDNILSFTIK